MDVVLNIFLSFFSDLNESTLRCRDWMEVKELNEDNWSRTACVDSTLRKYVLYEYLLRVLYVLFAALRTYYSLSNDCLTSQTVNIYRARGQSLASLLYNLHLLLATTDQACLVWLATSSKHCGF